MRKRKRVITRRAVVAGLTSLGGLVMSGCSGTEPPTYGNVLRMGDLLTYKAHQLLLPVHSLAKEYNHSDISSIAAIGNTDPGDEHQSGFNPVRGAEYARLRSGGADDSGVGVAGGRFIERCGYDDGNGCAACHDPT